MAVRTVPDPERAAGPAGTDAVRRRAADARDRTSADDAAEDPDSRRADARTCAGDPGDAVESARALATDHRHHRVARGAERDVCASARRPRLCARTRADRLGGRPGPVRSRGRRRVPLKIPKRAATTSLQVPFCSNLFCSRRITYRLLNRELDIETIGILPMSRR